MVEQAYKMTVETPYEEFESFTASVEEVYKNIGSILRFGCFTIYLDK